ncbi:MAG: histidinol-phosphate aminotransferase family protein [Methanoregulaceae archaeon]|nr:histidinol-phosphate aminotransferase family protein [Methanoregulaceae archaeon]
MGILIRGAIVRRPVREKAVHGGQVKRCEEKTGGRWIDFSASVNPVPPVTDWNLGAVGLADYPDDRYDQLKEVIGREFRRDPAEIAVGNGSIELIRAFCTAALDRGQQFYIEPPTFGEYALSARIAGAEAAMNPQDAAARFICHPNNPTGHLRPRSEIENALRLCRRHETMLLLDEAFIELADPKASLVGCRDSHLFLVRSLTKSFAVPGVRFGYGFGDPEFIATIEAIRPPWSVNAFAEAVAVEAFRHYGELETSRAYIRAERERLSKGLSDLGFTVEPSDANFLLTHTPVDAGFLCERLRSSFILVRDCSSFGLSSSIRVAIRTRDENNQLLEALSRCVP